MNISTTLSRCRELRRLLPIVASGLLLIALAYPMWRITLIAPQYPEYPDGLLVEVYAYPQLGGDFEEVQRLNRYVGFYFPDPVYVEPNYEVHEKAIKTPEWVLGPLAFLAVAAAGVFVALAPTTRKLKLGLTCQFVGTIAVFVTMFVFIQYRLRQAGHSLDPDAPLRGVSEFTPPLLGSYEVANITGIAMPATGAYITGVAIVLLGMGFLLRDSDATLRDLPALIRALPGNVRDSFGSLRRLPHRIRAYATTSESLLRDDAVNDELEGEQERGPIEPESRLNRTEVGGRG